MSRICRERVVTFWCTGQKNYGKLLRYMTPYDKDCDQGSHVREKMQTGGSFSLVGHGSFDKSFEPLVVAGRSHECVCMCGL